MANKGSPTSAKEIVNITELIWRIKEGEIKVFVFDEVSSEWKRLSSIFTTKKSLSTTIKTAQAVVGTTRIQLPELSSNQGILLKADRDNGGNIYIGGEGVTTSNGFKLSPGEAIYLEIDNANRVYAIADISNQKLYIVGLV